MWQNRRQRPVQQATIQDDRGGTFLLAPLKEAFPGLKLIWVDSGYKKEGFDEWVKATRGWEVEIVEHRLSWLMGRLGSERCRDRLGEDQTQWFSCASTPLDGRAHLRLAIAPFAGSPLP